MKDTTKDRVMSAAGLLLLGAAGAIELKRNKRKSDAMQAQKEFAAEVAEIRARVPSGTPPGVLAQASSILAGHAAAGQAALGRARSSPPAVPGAGYGPDFGFTMESGKQEYVDRRRLGDKD